MGRMATGAKVVLRTGHKWADLVFWNHTGLRTCVWPPSCSCALASAMSVHLAHFVIVVFVVMIRLERSSI